MKAKQDFCNFNTRYDR